MPDDTDAEESKTDVIGWLIPIAQVSGVVAAVLFGAFHFALSYFYSFLGVIPSEVGWDLQRVLVQFLPAFLLVFVVVLLTLLGMRSPRGGSKGESNQMQTIGPRTIVVSAAIVLALLFAAATALAQHVKGGGSLTGSPDRAFPVAAHCVDVIWLDAVTPAAEASVLTADRPFLYLGRAEGIVVLYDAERDVPIRLPANRIMMTGCSGR